MTNEFRSGLNGGTVLFFDAVAPGLFSPWKGFSRSFASPGTGLSAVTATNGPQRRNAPVKNIGDTVTLVRGSHQISFGGSYDQINLFQVIVGSSEIPRIAFGIATNDPIFNGSTNIFTAANLPGSTSTQQSQAANLYADVTGPRIQHHPVAGAERSQPPIRHRRAHRSRSPARSGLFCARSVAHRAEPHGDHRLPCGEAVRLRQDNLYSAVSYAGLWGLSGVGNLFQPGSLSGTAPVYTQITGSPYSPPVLPAPSVGLAWQLPAKEGFLGAITGHHSGAAVLRGGYAIASVREGMNVFQNLFGSNQGLNIDASTSPTTFPANFGPGGSVNFNDATLPSRISSLPTTPTYPISPTFTTSVNGFDPSLKTGYVQSWNLSYQRELDRNAVLEFRYNGNHGTDLWRQYALDDRN